jgi:serine/threonine protein kinase
MLIVDPEKRVTAAQLLEDNWLKSKSNPEKSKQDINASQISQNTSTIKERTSSTGPAGEVALT